MLRLGFKQFYVQVDKTVFDLKHFSTLKLSQGGDWGSIILTFMSVLYPDNLLGAHSNMCMCDMSLCHLKYWLFG